jgi:DNA-binding IclR family transcriptional regulator
VAWERTGSTALADGVRGAGGPSVASKVFAILNAFVPGETRLTLSEISRRTGLPLPTAHRLVGELVRFGGLEREDRRTYRIGVRLWELGSLAPIRGGLRELAMPFMEDLYEATHENIQLAVLADLEAIVVEKISGRTSVPVITRVGGRLPLHPTGVGKVLLAHAPEEFIDRFIASGLSRYASRTIVDPRRLRDDLELTRARGFSVTRDEMTEGAVSVGAPIFGPEQEVVAALSVVVDSRIRDPERLAPPVRTAARGLTRQIVDSWDRIEPLVPPAILATGPGGEQLDG